MSFQSYAESARTRFHIGEMNKPVKVGIVVVLAMCVCVLCFSLFGAKPHEVEVKKADAKELVALPEGNQNAGSELYVHVAGCVQKPGMYKLERGSRLAQAVEAAGGFTDSAATESVNLARELQDGEQIVVADKNSESLSSLSAHNQSAAQSGSSNSGNSTGRVNINTANEQQLQTISGIGPSKAKKIIAYRDSQGPFKSVDDLSKVSGIGEKTLESIRDQICV